MWLIVIPKYCPPSVNHGLGRRAIVKHKLTQQVTERLVAYNAVANCPRIREGYRPKRVVAMTVYKSGVKPDPDNLLKHTLDGLKNARLIVDDSEKYLRWVPPIVVRPDEHGERTEIRIRDDSEVVTIDPVASQIRAFARPEVAREIYAVLTATASSASPDICLADVLWLCANALSKEFVHCEQTGPLLADADLFS